MPDCPYSSLPLAICTNSVVQFISERRERAGRVHKVRIRHCYLSSKTPHPPWQRNAPAGQLRPGYLNRRRATASIELQQFGRLGTGFRLHYSRYYYYLYTSSPSPSPSSTRSLPRSDHLLLSILHCLDTSSRTLPLPLLHKA